MPILIKDYTWKQTNERVTVRVPLRGVHPSKADVFTFDNFIKVHFPPFLFEVCLRDVIDEEKSKCQKVRDEVIFELVKKEEGPWDVLEAPLTKSEMIAVKERAIELLHKTTEAKKKQKEEKKASIQRKAVSDQIKLDTEVRNRIDAIKELIKNNTMSELEEWRKKQTQNSSTDRLSIVEIQESAEEKTNSKSETNNQISDKTDKKTRANINTRNERESKMIFNEPIEKVNRPNLGKHVGTAQKNKNQANAEVPLPRVSGKISVTFSPRAFPTPSRESKLEEETEWLTKQAEARRRTGFVIEDLRPEELDPVWLKDKGDSFYKVGNYLGAISAYSHGIKLNPKMASLYSNRSAAHLALGNLRRVIQDTTKALELFTPCVEMNAASRSLCHARRGTALCQMNSLKAGLADLEEAFKLCPNNKGLEADIRHVRKQLEDPLHANSIEEEDADFNETGIE